MDPRGCGRDVLDNLRGQCGGLVLDWRCDAAEVVVPGEPLTVTLRFGVPDLWGEACVRAGIFLANGWRTRMGSCASGSEA